MWLKETPRATDKPIVILFMGNNKTKFDSPLLHGDLSNQINKYKLKHLTRAIFKRILA